MGYSTRRHKAIVSEVIKTHYNKMQVSNDILTIGNEIVDKYIK